MLVLGIYDGHNAGCALISGGEILFAVEEERLSRIKCHDGRDISHGLPTRSLSMVAGQLNGRRPDKIAIAMEAPESLRETALATFAQTIIKQKCNEILRYYEAVDPRTCKKYGITATEYYDISYATQANRLRNILSLLESQGLNDVEIELIPHHQAHHASCFFTTSDDDGIIFSLDGRGDALSGAVSTFEGTNLKKHHEISSLNSLGHFYSAVTVALGFTPVKHEGKITGLAAFTKADASLLRRFQQLIGLSEGCMSIESTLFQGEAHGPYPFGNLRLYVERVKAATAGFGREVVAATAQKHVEDVVCNWISYWVERTKKQNVFLCGGVFSNVKLNQRVSEIDEVKSVTVHPGMTDCGLPVGAAFAASQPIDRRAPDSYYLGPDVTQYGIEELMGELKDCFSVTKPKNLAGQVAQLLYDKKIVARFSGRLEYGPRALGNRSILFHAGDKSANDWLNNRLKRTEFMPFAPVTLAENCALYYDLPRNTDILESLKYMTMTVSCTDFMKQNCPAAVHVDGTARPQLIAKSTNPDYYSILTEYKELSGIGTLVNTSFNLHDEPIVNTPKEALAAFDESNLHALIMGDYLIERCI
jgi:carbamoyltransferase